MIRLRDALLRRRAGPAHAGREPSATSLGASTFTVAVLATLVIRAKRRGNFLGGPR